MENITDQTIPPPAPKRRKRLFTWIAVCLLTIVAVLLVIGEIVIHRAGPILKGRVLETLRNRFDSRVEMGNFNVSLLSGIEVSGDDLRIYPPPSVVAAGASQPLIALKHFSFHSGVMGLFAKPTHVGTVLVSGLQIVIPPRQMREFAPDRPDNGSGEMKIVVDTIVCDNSRLIIGTANPDKDPKDFELKHIEMHNVGPDHPWRYDATLVNAVPRGDIHATGTFGPWQTESPGDSSVTGHYKFEHADLNTIKGIGGILSSVGDFKGELDKIVVDGTTDTPDFSIDTANHPMPLHTQFHAVVDGTSGDTYLEPVKARLHDSSFTAKGAIINIKGKGHRIALDVDVPRGRLQDFLDFAVKTQPPVMTGSIHTRMKLNIPPGDESVSQKLALQGQFTLGNIHFTNPQVQDKVDMLSLRAQGDPKDAKPGAEDVASEMKARLTMQQGKLQFAGIVYVFPGARVNLDGVYSLDGSEFDFRGNVLTAATLSQMVASRWKSWMLKPISPFFKKDGAGAKIPVKITGTKSEPKFGLDVHFPGGSDNQASAARRNP